MRGIDVALQELPGGVYDLKVGFDGDLETEDAFETAIVVSLFTDARAPESLVADPALRRGWIGNEYRLRVAPGFDLGSILWAFLEQGRLRGKTLRDLEDASNEALQWLVDRGYAVAISEVSATTPSPGQVRLGLTIERSPGVVERRFFDLWQNTGA